MSDGHEPDSRAVRDLTLDEAIEEFLTDYLSTDKGRADWHSESGAMTESRGRCQAPEEHLGVHRVVGVGLVAGLELR